MRIPSLVIEFRPLAPHNDEVPRSGIEPLAYPLGGGRSIRLSYRGLGAKPLSRSILRPYEVGGVLNGAHIPAGILTPEKATASGLNSTSAATTDNSGMSRRQPGPRGGSDTQALVRVRVGQEDFRGDVVRWLRFPNNSAETCVTLNPPER